MVISHRLPYLVRSQIDDSKTWYNIDFLDAELDTTYS